MPILEKLLLAAGIGRSVYGKWRMQRLMTAVVTMAILAVITAVMGSVLAIGGMVAVYSFLLNQAVTPATAMLVVALIALFFTLALLGNLRRRMRELKSSVSSPMTDVTDGFLDGLFSE